MAVLALEQQKRKRWAYLALGVVLLLFLGLIYAWSVFRVPLEQEFGWAKGETSLTFSISMMMFCLGGLVSGIVTAKKGVRFTLIFSAIFLAAGFMLASRADSLLFIYITYGGLAGFGSGLGYNLAAIVGGAFVPTIATWLSSHWGVKSVGLYLAVMAACCLVAVLTCHETKDADYTE